MRRQIANVITGSRIVFGICLLFCPVFSAAFYIMYLVCGITDMTDGAIARKTKTVSELGARLDTAADLVFIAMCLVKILPLIQLPIWIWIWIATIAIVKIGNIAWGFICSRKLMCLHTLSNKAAGFLLFLFPLMLDFIEPIWSSVAVCSVAMLAAIKDVYYIRKGIEIF